MSVELARTLSGRGARRVEQFRHGRGDCLDVRLLLWAFCYQAAPKSLCIIPVTVVKVALLRSRKEGALITTISVARERSASPLPSSHYLTLRPDGPEACARFALLTGKGRLRYPSKPCSRLDLPYSKFIHGTMEQRRNPHLIFLLDGPIAVVGTLDFHKPERGRGRTVDK